MEIPTGWIIFNILASYPLSVNFYPSHIGSNGIWILDMAGIRGDGHLLFEVEMYLQKGCIIVSGVESS